MPTPSQLLDTVRNQVYENEASFWGDQEIFDYLWQGEWDLAKQLQCTESTDATTSTVADTQEYAVPSDCIMVTRVTWDGVKLKKIDHRELDALDNPGYGSSSSTGSPTHYYEWGSVVGLWPIPSDAKPLKFWYINEPDRLTSTSASLSIPNVFGVYLVDYALYRMYLKDQDEGRSNMHLMLWNGHKEQAKLEWRKIKRRDKYSVVRNEDNFPVAEDGII